jgi:hypothetical protein
MLAFSSSTIPNDEDVFCSECLTSMRRRDPPLSLESAYLFYKTFACASSNLRATMYLKRSISTLVEVSDSRCRDVVVMLVAFDRLQKDRDP